VDLAKMVLFETNPGMLEAKQGETLSFLKLEASIGR
jgi:hypothetical protein